jgi:hypothetical protein
VVLICRGEKPIAELRRPTAAEPGPALVQAEELDELVVDRKDLPLHPELSRVEFYEDPVAPLDPEDWPDADH